MNISIYTILITGGIIVTAIITTIVITFKIKLNLAKPEVKFNKFIDYYVKLQINLTSYYAQSAY